MSSQFGQSYRFTVFGESHAPEIGVIIEGLPAGIPIDREALQAFLNRRAPGRTEWSTSRREADKVLFTDGLDADGITQGGPLRAVIENSDARPADYEAFKTVPRPGHADYPAFVKTGRIPSGGGIWSGRMTAPYCIAGGIALQLLAKEGIRITARIGSIGGIRDTSPFTESREHYGFTVGEETSPLTVKRYQEKIAAAKSQGDSVGGTVECRVTGLPAGLGSHPFDGLENRLSEAVFAIPAVKGIEFGDGFALADGKGSETNDAFRYQDGRVVTLSNHCGGILGGMSDGMPLVFRAAFKPTPTILREQASVDLSSGENVPVKGTGRHDPCIVPRAVPVVEAAAAAALYDLLLKERASSLASGSGLDALRRQIDEADRALLSAFIARMEASEKIADYKKAQGLLIRDEAREEALLEKIAGGTPEALKKYSRELWQTLFALSRAMQAERTGRDS